MKSMLCGATLLAAGLLVSCAASSSKPLPVGAAYVPLDEREVCRVVPTTFQRLASTAECQHCTNWLLPGSLLPSPHSVYSIHSDLPEIVTSPGVAYATTAVLPAFNMKNGDPVPDHMLVQDNRGFRTIDGSFETFLFHISQPGDGTQPRRMVVYARNKGKDTVTVDPRQVIVTDGIIGTVHEMESTLGRRVLAEEWDRPLQPLTIAPGEGRVVHFSKQFSAPRNNEDSSANVNCFGLTRADVSSVGKPDLEVYVLAIPADADLSRLDALAEEYLAVGANSGEGYIDLSTEPQGCQLRRACGVFKSFVWENDPAIVDVAAVPKGGMRFQMALPEVQTNGCPEARQTQDLLLSQKFNRPDTVGNYMVEYRLRFHLVNHDTENPQKVDLRFGKKDADIGLAWQIAKDDFPFDWDEVAALPVHTGWAGPKQEADFPDDTRSLLENDGGAFILEPCQDAWITVRFMVLGNSSLPFQLGFVTEEQRPRF